MAQVLAQLAVRRGREALAFYREAFGAQVVYQVGNEDSVVAQLQIGEGSFWISDESPEHRNFSPETLGGATTKLALIVDDPDQVMAQAIEAGATEVNPVTEQHGWRMGRVTDPFGHDWEIGHPLGPWPPS